MLLQQNDFSNTYRGDSMHSQNIARDYKMNDSEMCFLESKICSYLTRDLADLQDFGID